MTILVIFAGNGANDLRNPIRFVKESLSSPSLAAYSNLRFAPSHPPPPSFPPSNPMPPPPTSLSLSVCVCVCTRGRVGRLCVDNGAGHEVSAGMWRHALAFLRDTLTTPPPTLTPNP